MFRTLRPNLGRFCLGKTYEFTAVIIDFDYTKVHQTNLLSNYILFKDYGEMKAHCGFTYDRNGKDLYYPETFFVQDNDYYIKNQDIYSVVDVKIEKYR